MCFDTHLATWALTLGGLALQLLCANSFTGRLSLASMALTALVCKYTLAFSLFDTSKMGQDLMV